MKTFGMARDREIPPFIEEQKKRIAQGGFFIDPQNWFLVGKNPTWAGRKKWRKNLIDTLQEGDTLVCFNLASFGGTIGYIAELVVALLMTNAMFAGAKKCHEQ